MRSTEFRLLATLAALLFESCALSDGRFDLQLRKVELPEMGAVTRCQLSTDKGSYGFMPPYNWRIEADTAAKRINLTSPESTLITVRSLSAGPTSPGMSASAWREILSRQYPDAKILEEFEAIGGGATGRAFDLEFEGKPGPRLLIRVVFIPMAGELLEFHLAARADRFRGDTLTLSSLLTSFQAASAVPGNSNEEIK